MEPEPVVDKYDPYNTVPDEVPVEEETTTHENTMAHEMAIDDGMDDVMEEEEPKCKIMGPNGECFRTKADLEAAGYHADPITIDYTSPVFHAKRVDRPLQCDAWAIDGENCSGRVVKSKKNTKRPTRRYQSSRTRPSHPIKRSRGGYEQ